MVNQQKIIIMTKLALYDKHDGPADRAANDFFRHDYIYKKNLGTRIAVGFGGMLILALYWISVLFEGDVDVFELNVQDYLLESFLFILALLAVYSVVGTIQGTREYYLIQKRLTTYQTHLRNLERGGERRRRKRPTSESANEARRRERMAEREARRARRKESLQDPKLDSLRTHPISRSINEDESNARLVRRRPLSSDTRPRYSRDE